MSDTATGLKVGPTNRLRTETDEATFQPKDLQR
jgi:hypothetical protein